MRMYFLDTIIDTTPITGNGSLTKRWMTENHGMKTEKVEPCTSSVILQLIQQYQDMEMMCSSTFSQETARR